MRELLCYDFERKGHQVFQAESGNKAFDFLANNSVDLVISDIRMPDGDGLQLLEKIKQRSTRVPLVIFITGFTETSLEEVYDRGADALFYKPFDRAALFKTVNKVLLDSFEKETTRRSSRTEVDIDIHINFIDLERKMQTKMLNIGRGGFFIELQNNYPKIDSKVEFELNLILDKKLVLLGTGTVKWIRNTPNSGHPMGCGIEFDELTDASRKKLVQIINELRIRSYIPRK
jgi:CheY-like chemotaxis protein